MAMTVSNATIPGLPCQCATLRRATRVLTQHYEAGLRPFGVRASQFTILQVLSLAGEVSQGRLGQMLAMDTTTLTRTLRVMAHNGWIADRRGKDRRERFLRLTRAGNNLLNRALPVWEQVQARLSAQLGSERWQQLFALANQVAALTTNEDSYEK
jgi:DNA-binding MarR family transcriptional regulator